MLSLEESTRHPVELWMGRRPLPISMETKASKTVHQFMEEEALCVAPGINTGPVDSSLWLGAPNSEHGDEEKLPGVTAHKLRWGCLSESFHGVSGASQFKSRPPDVLYCPTPQGTLQRAGFSPGRMYNETVGGRESWALLSFGP